MKKILRVLIFVVMFSSSISVNALSLNNSTRINTLKDAFINEFGDDYIKYLDDNNYELNVAQKIDDLFKKNYDNSYPDYYGGMYISEDSKNLIIQIVEDKIPQKDSSDYLIYEKIISIDNTIITRFVNNSFNELNNINNLINNGIKHNENISSTYIDVINNNVVIELLDNTQSRQQEFKNSLSNYNLIDSQKSISGINSKLISFKQGEINKLMSSKASLTDIRPGQSIDVPGGICSASFRTKYNGKEGYMTAGHCVMIDGTNTTLRTGKVKVFQFADQQVGDYAFVQTIGYTPSNIMRYGMNNLDVYQMNLLVTTAPTLVVGTAIAKEGATTGYTAGTINALNKNIYYNSVDKTIKGLVSAQISVSDGDSGGVVFIPKSNFSAIPIGIVSGGNSTNGYFTSIHNLPASLITGRY